MKLLYLDLRNNDEIEKIRFKKEYANVGYIPADIIKYNLEYLENEFNKYDEIILICSTGYTSNIIKNKYYSNNDNIKVASKHFDDFDIIKEKNNIIYSDGYHMNLTKKVQLISGSIILLIFFLGKKDPVFFNFYLILAIVMLYVSISGNCFMSKFLTQNDY